MSECNLILIRRVRSADRDALHALQLVSIRQLVRAYYDDDVVEAFVKQFGTMNDRLLDEGRFFGATLNHQFVGCGGWSMRNSVPVATVRSVFVHPDFTRRGIAGYLMEIIEDDMRRNGANLASVTAALSGVPFYTAIGYRSGDAATIALRNDLQFVGIEMQKWLTDCDKVTAAA
jgi:GNAT superfamily N-acetyltransferase